MERDSIIVSVSELRSLIQDIRRSGSDYVKISISEEDVIDGEPYPAELNFSACKSSAPDIWFDFESLEEVSNHDELDKKSLYGAHMSSNLL